MKYDIVFWGHVNNGIERYLPLMASLKKKKFKPLLFYQNYDFSDGLSGVQLDIIDKYGLDVLDYSYFLKDDLILKVISFFVRLFRVSKINTFYNKFRGLRSKVLKPKITEQLVRKILLELGPKISFFDNISLVKYVDYPYGSYYIKKLSDELGIKTVSICHGGTVHKPKMAAISKNSIDFSKIYEPNFYEKEWDEMHVCRKDTEVLSVGDPRSDQNWKKAVKGIYSQKIDRKIRKMGIGSGFNILYLCGNTEQFGREEQKYKDIADLTRLCREIGNATMLIKPHPRYRMEKKIRKTMRGQNFKNFFILGDDPLICYQDHVDLFITLGTSAIQDLLPESYRKIIIYDTIYADLGLKNVFSEILPTFNNYGELSDYVKKYVAGKLLFQNSEDAREKAVSFSKKWIAAGNEPDAIVEAITNDMINDLKILEQTTSNKERTWTLKGN